MEFEEWYEIYANKKIIDLNKELQDEDLKILSILNIKIKKEMYTQREYELLMAEVGAYYNKDEMSKLSDEDLQYVKSLEETGISEKEYRRICKKISDINNKYSIYM